MSFLTSKASDARVTWIHEYCRAEGDAWRASNLRLRLEIEELKKRLSLLENANQHKYECPVCAGSKGEE